MSQSRKDLRNFRDYYDEVAKKYGLPLLSGNLYATRPNASLEEQTAGRYEEEYIAFNNFQWTTADNYGSYQIPKTVPNANPYNISPTTNIQNLSAIQNVNAILEPIINLMRDDMQYFFNLGYGGNENE